jgi:hypothetical protein
MTDTPKVGDFVWHLHHDKLLEPLIEPFEVRVAYIKTDKPKVEIETRLRLMKPVRGHLPILDKAHAEWVKANAEWVRAYAEWDKAHAELDKAYAEWDKAYAKWGKTYAEWDKARAELDKAHAEWVKADAEWVKAYADPSVLALHANECPDCPWDGKTIFPEATA